MQRFEFGRLEATRPTREAQANARVTEADRNYGLKSRVKREPLAHAK